MLPVIAWISLGLAFASALWIAAGEIRHPQKMWIMNIVWPVTALYFGVVGVWAYYKIGLPMRKGTQSETDGGQHTQNMEQARKNPTWAQVAVSASHCGAGCALGDVAAEFAVFRFGLTLFGATLWADYVVDLAAAWLLGIFFQYFAIKPMGNLSPGKALTAAIKADTLTIIAFQIGMYAWMGLTHLVFFPQHHLHPDDARFWFFMQIAMIIGFFTSYPMNEWLIKRGIKEVMG
jgi:hypothetical protein